jgi:hypothetical protein
MSLPVQEQRALFRLLASRLDGSEPAATEHGGPGVALDARRVCGIEIPEALDSIADAVEKSEYILHLPDDWDDEGSPHYERETWERAVKFVLRNAVELWRKERVRAEPPAVQNGPEGSIDIHWRSPGAELLINVPSTPDRPATFHGLNKSARIETKGNLDISAPNEWLLMWIAAK